MPSPCFIQDGQLAMYFGQDFSQRGRPSTLTPRSATFQQIFTGIPVSKPLPLPESSKAPWQACSPRYRSIARPARGENSNNAPFQRVHGNLPLGSRCLGAMHRSFPILVATSHEGPPPIPGTWIRLETENAIECLSTESGTFDDFQFLREDLDDF